MYETQKLIETVDISKLPKDVQERIEDLKTLSDNFSEESDEMKEMDKVLAQKIKAETGKAPKKSGKRVTHGADTPAARLQAAIAELIEAEKEGEKVDTARVREIVESTLEDRKISFKDLGDDVKDFLSSKRVVTYEIPEYDVVADVTETEKAIPHFLDVVDDMLMHNNVLLIGEAGTGKTYLANEVAGFLKRKTAELACNQYTSPLDIIGGQTIEGYKEGKLVDAWRNGKILILDEMPKLDPNSAGILNDALAKTKLGDRAIIEDANGDKVLMNPNFGCIATGNVYPNVNPPPEYLGNSRQDISLLDRFSGSVYYIGENRKLEKLITPEELDWLLTDLAWPLREKMKELGYENTAVVSLRTIRNFEDSARNEMRIMNWNEDNADAIRRGEADPLQGKTLRDAIDSYLTAFTYEQRGNLKKAINYDEFMAEYPKKLDDARRKLNMKKKQQVQQKAKAAEKATA